MLQNVTEEKIPPSLDLFMPPRRPPAGRHPARLFLQPQQPRYLGDLAETVETPAISLELSISATTLWAAAPTRFPSAAAIPAHSTIQCPPSMHPTYPSAHFARVGVRSESPHPAERTFKKKCRFTWDWQPQRPPSSPPAAGKLERPPHHPALRQASARARVLTSNRTSTSAPRGSQRARSSLCCHLAEPPALIATLAFATHRSLRLSRTSQAMRRWQEPSPTPPRLNCSPLSTTLPAASRP